MEEVKINENDSYTINKPITIKNGNVKDGTFIVERSGVKFENISKIEAITVDEKVGSGDFTIKGCHDVDNMWVNGGGSNSIHIANSSITQFLVNKPLVRIVLDKDDDGCVQIKNAIIGQECKIESESGNSLENVILAKDEATVALAGTMKITNLVGKNFSKESGSQITISKENASLSDTGIDEAEINQAIENANENLSDSTSLVKQDEPKGPKDLKLTSEACNDGILIKIANPPKAAIESGEYFMRAFIDGIGSVCQYFYKLDDNSPNEFFYPYVQKGKMYKVRIWYWLEIKDKDGYSIPNLRTDLSWSEINVEARGGKGGDLMLVSPQEIISMDSSGNFKLKAPEFAQEPSEFDWEMVVELYKGKSWNVKDTKGWGWLGGMNIPKSEMNSTHNIYDYLKNEWSTEGMVEFIGIHPRIIYERGETNWEYNWPAVTKDDMTPISCTRQDYSKLDATPLKVKSIEEMPAIPLEKDELYMFTYPITTESNKRKIRMGDEYVIDFSAKSSIDLEASWMTLIYTREIIGENGNKTYGWWHYPSEDFWYEKLEESPTSANGTLNIKKTIAISKENAEANETPCILIYIKPNQYRTDLEDTPLKEVSATITSSNVNVIKE